MLHSWNFSKSMKKLKCSKLYKKLCYLKLRKMFQNFFSCYTNVPRTLHYVSQKFQEPKKNQNERRAEHTNGKPGLRLRLVSRFSPRRVQAARQVGCNPLVLRHVRASSRTLGIDLPGYAHVGVLVQSILRALLQADLSQKGFQVQWF